MKEIVFIMTNDRNHPILINHENEMIRISLYISYFSLRRAALSSELLIYFKYNNHIQDRKLWRNEIWMWRKPNKRKNTTTHSGVFLNLVAHWYKISTFFLASESCQKSREKNIRNFLSVLDTLWTKSDNFQPSTNNLEEIPCVFFVNTM